MGTIKIVGNRHLGYASIITIECVKPGKILICLKTVNGNFGQNPKFF